MRVAGPAAALTVWKVGQPASSSSFLCWLPPGTFPSWILTQLTSSCSLTTVDFFQTFPESTSCSIFCFPLATSLSLSSLGFILEPFPSWLLPRGSLVSWLLPWDLLLKIFFVFFVNLPTKGFFLDPFPCWLCLGAVFRWIFSGPFPQKNLCSKCLPSAFLDRLLFGFPDDYPAYLFRLYFLETP